MSFLKTPDTNAKSDIPMKDAVHLLLTSIAMEKICLSKLLDLKKDQAGYEPDHCPEKNLQIQNVPKEDQSTGALLKAAENLQVLLQEENFCTAMPSATECLTGNGSGYIENCCDTLHGMPVLLHALLYCENSKSNMIRYTAGTLSEGLTLCASNFHVRSFSPDLCWDALTVYGRGRAKRYWPCQRKVSGEVQFTLTIRQSACGEYEFRMETTSGSDACLNHDSGFVKAQRMKSNLCIRDSVCCGS